MPITAATIYPIEAVTPQIGDAGCPSIPFLSDITTIAKGDVLIWDATPDGRLIDSNALATGINLVGIAVHAASAVDAQVMVNLALPGTVFVGTVATVTGDADVASGVRGTHIGRRYAFGESNGLACLDLGVAAANTQPAASFRWGRQRSVVPDPVTNPYQATVAAVNPRVEFMIVSSYWNSVT